MCRNETLVDCFSNKTTNNPISTTTSAIHSLCIEAEIIGFGCMNGATCIFDPNSNNLIKCICPPNFTGFVFE